MATLINTSDDLLKLLSENTEFYQAVRRLILTDELIELPERFARFAARVDNFIIRQEQFNEEQRGFKPPNPRLAISELKGNTARYVVGVLFGEIAEQLGYAFKDTLSRQQLRQLIGPQGHTDVSSGDRHSFIRADLVVVTEDKDANTHYIAVEASYTADARDSSRAQRNAQLTAALHRLRLARHDRQRPQRPGHPTRDRQRRHPLVRPEPRRLHTGIIEN